MTEALAPLSPHEWESYYVIVGSSAGALTGLQFVVMTLIADTPAVSSSEESISAFGTPNVVHFCSALLVSAIFSAPWRALGPPGVATAVTGALGVLYALMVMRRAVRQHKLDVISPGARRNPTRTRQRVIGSRNRDQFDAADPDALKPRDLHIERPADPDRCRAVEHHLRHRPERFDTEA